MAWPTGRAAGVPAHVLLHEATLIALASLRPSTLPTCSTCLDMGPVKAARFGDETPRRRGWYPRRGGSPAGGAATG